MNIVWYWPIRHLIAKGLSSISNSLLHWFMFVCEGNGKIPATINMDSFGQISGMLRFLSFTFWLDRPASNYGCQCFLISAKMLQKYGKCYLRRGRSSMLSEITLMLMPKGKYSNNIISFPNHFLRILKKIKSSCHKMWLTTKSEKIFSLSSSQF